MRRRRLALALALVGGVASCLPETSSLEHGLTATAKRERLELIRDAAAEMGVHNAALIAGIAVSETNLAHCWSEATYACMGPASSSCADGPVIAGAADGPCADQQGGLGMFQFDAGTHDQTLAAYGPSILTVEGNTAQAVAFVIDRLPLELADTGDWMKAAAFINGVPMQAGDPAMEQWAAFLACRYNGCCSSSTTCVGRGMRYRDNALDLYAEQGAAFWQTADRCARLPDDGIIDQRTACYVAAGDPRFWRREATGFGDASEWTSTTRAADPANFARWLLRAGGPDRLAIELYLSRASGGDATAATYRIVHAGVVDTVVVDQSTIDGFVSLGEYDVDGTGDEYVELADNTGTQGQRLVVDALRVTSLAGPGERGPDSGCTVAPGRDRRGDAWRSAMFGVAVGLAALRRRRPRARRVG